MTPSYSSIFATAAAVAAATAVVGVAVAVADDGVAGAVKRATSGGAITASASSWCGDGIVEGSEECDDGNENDYDDCYSCTIGRCGNGIKTYDEECDDGNLIDGDGLRQHSARFNSTFATLMCRLTRGRERRGGVYTLGRCRCIVQPQPAASRRRTNLDRRLQCPRGRRLVHRRALRPALDPTFSVQVLDATDPQLIPSAVS